jgi:putative ABC transport system permease protein
MGQVWADLRIAWRSLSRARGFSAAVVGTLALAIGLEASVMAVVNAYLIRSLPYPGGERLHSVFYARPGQNTPPGLANLSWTSTSDVVEHPISWDLDYFYLVGGDHPEAVPGAWVNPGFMQGLGIRPAIGRPFTRDEFEPGGPQVALISHALWQSRFGGDPAIMGRLFEAYVSDRPGDPDVFTIVGVLPDGFWHLNPYTQVLTPLRAPSYPYIVKLRERVPAALVADRITDLLRDGGVSLPPDGRVELRSVHAEYSRRVRPMLLVIGTAVSLVLLTACANVAFLMLLRGLRRQKEVAVRLALGAGSGRVARLLVGEALLLSAGGALVGTVAAALVIRRLAPVVEQQLGRPAPGGPSAVSVDLAVLAAVGVVTLLISAVLALAPLLATSRQALFAMMRRGRQSGPEGSRGRRTRLVLISLEIAGSLTLVVGAGLTARTVMRMLEVNMGLEPAGVITGAIALRERRYPDAAARQAFYHRLTHALEQTSGVMSAALSYPPPLGELDPRPVETETAMGTSRSRAGMFVVTPGYFTTLEIPLLLGRVFTDQDRGARAPVALVSETAARQLWPGGAALGKGIRVTAPGFMTNQAPPVTRTVVGVVGDVRHSPADDQVADVYLPWLQTPGRFAGLMVRAPGSAQAWLGNLRRMLREIDPEISLDQVRLLDEAAREQLARPRFLAALFAAFGGFATTLGLIGVYAVIAYAVKQREHEVAVRMAVGADAGAVIGLFARDGAVVLLIGLAVGTLGAVGLGRVLEAQLYGVRAVDPLTLVATSLGLAVACGAAIWWPARRASRTDPAIALREE